MRNDDGLFTFRRVRPVLEADRSSTGAREADTSSGASFDAGQYRWHVVSHVPPEVLTAASDRLGVNLARTFAVLLVLLGLAAWYLGRMHRWRASGYQQVRMSVNLAGAQFEQPGLQMRAAQALEKSGLAPRQLMLEITEGTLMRQRSDTQRRIQELKDLGVGFALDDFGTGYSSLSYLKRFALTAVKIDRSFVAGLGRDPKDAAIVAAIIAMAQGLELEAIAEGVETSEQWNFLAKLGCSEAQGFLLAHSLSHRKTDNVGFIATDYIP